MAPVGKKPACQCRRLKSCRFDPWVWKIPWRRAWKHYSSTLAWEIPWTEEPGGLQSVGSQSQTRPKRLSIHARTHARPHGKEGTRQVDRTSPKRRNTQRRGLRWEWGIFLSWNSEWCGDRFLQNTITGQRRPQPNPTKCVSSKGGRRHQHVKNLKMVKNTHGRFMLMYGKTNTVL